MYLCEISSTIGSIETKRKQTVKLLKILKLALLGFDTPVQDKLKPKLRLFLALN